MEKLDIKAVASIVESEGIGYAVTEYINSDRFEDEDLAKLWDEAQAALNELDSYLEPHYESV